LNNPSLKFVGKINKLYNLTMEEDAMVEDLK